MAKNTDPVETRLRQDVEPYAARLTAVDMTQLT